MNYLEEYKKWCESSEFDEETNKELEFGTAGLRGVIGAGTNRMNKYTVGKATQGLANYILEQGTQDKGVAISYDSRRMSKEFSLLTALILNANGIKTYLFENLRPVPELSFTVRKLKCTAGVMITASHNPPKYNGYKVYWDDGAQIVEPRDKEIIAKVRAVESFSEIKEISKEEAIEKGLFNVIGTTFFMIFLTPFYHLFLTFRFYIPISPRLQLAFIHGFFNIVTTLLIFPFYKHIITLIESCFKKNC